MKLLTVILCLAALSLAYASPTPTPVAESIPTEVRKFFRSLNEDEKGAFKEYAKGVREGTKNFSLSDNDFLNDLREESESLFLKLSGVRDIINSKLETLKPESRVFLEKVIRLLISVFGEGDWKHVLVGLKNFGRDVLGLFDVLPEGIKQDILQGFPTIGSIATNDLFRLLVNKLADYVPEFSGKTANGTDVHPRPATPAPEVGPAITMAPEPEPKPPKKEPPTGMYPKLPGTRAPGEPADSVPDNAGEEVVNVKLINT